MIFNRRRNYGANDFQIILIGYFLICIVFISFLLSYFHTSFSIKSSLLSVPACIAFLLLLFSSSAIAHTINYDMREFSTTDVGLIYLKLGYLHILPLGMDHILFVLSIFLINTKLKPVIAQMTVFTIAHSITLGLGMYGVIKLPASVVEPIIALSIVFVALENIILDKVNTTRYIIIFAFGLIHGMGFAGVLLDLGLPPQDYVLGLISFNVGMELGQISVILLAYFLLSKWFIHKPYYKRKIVIPISIVIACIASFWVIERVFFIQ